MTGLLYLPPLCDQAAPDPATADIEIVPGPQWQLCLYRRCQKLDEHAPGCATYTVSQVAAAVADKLRESVARAREER